MANRYLITNDLPVSWTSIDTSIWSATSGGATGASVPGAADNVIMDGNSGTGTVTLTYGALVASIDFGAFNGGFSQGGNSISTGVMIGSGTGTRAFDPGGSIIILTGSGIVWDFDVTTNLTIVTPPSVFMTDVSAASKTFRTGAGAVDYALIGISGGGAGQIIFDQSNDLTVTNFVVTVGSANIQFTSGITYTATAFVANGTAGNRLLYMSASTPGAAFTLSVASGDVECDYLSITDSTATGGATFTAINSIDVSGNTGWVFLDQPRPLTARRSVLPYTTAPSFNGTSTFLEKTTPVGLPTGTTSRSVSGWVWLNDPAFGIGAVAGFVTGTNAPVGLIGQFGGVYYYAIDTTNAANNLTLTTAQFNAAFKFRKWHWVCWEFTNTTVTLYVDNVLVKTESWGVAMNTGAYTSLQLGKIRTNTYYFNGCMKDIRIHSGVMTARQRENEYLFGSVASTVVGRYLMEDGMSSTTVADSVGSNNLTGTALTWQARNVPVEARPVRLNQTGSPRFDGSTGYIDFGSHASYQLGAAGGFECEFFLDKNQVDTNTANSRFLICIDNGGSTNWILLAITNTTEALLALDARKASVSTALLTAAPHGVGLKDSRWHKVACGWDANGGLIVLDGALAAKNAVDMTATLTGTPAMVSGRLGAGFNLRYLTGMVRNFKLLSSKPTLAQCQASYLYNAPYSNLLAAWDCNDLYNTNVPLTSGAGNAGTLMGGMLLVSDAPSKARPPIVDLPSALSYNGSTQYGLATSVAFANTTQLTVVGWIRFPSKTLTPTTAEILMESSVNYNLNNAFIMVRNIANNAARCNSLGFGVSNSGAAYSRVETNQLDLNRWYHFVATIDQTLGSRQAKIYIDGCLNSEIVQDGNTTGGIATNNFYVASRAGTTAFAKEDLTGVYIVKDKAFTAAEALAAYQSGQRPSGGSLLASWPSTSWGSTSIPDASGNGFALALTAAPTWHGDTPGKARKQLNPNLVYNGDFEIRPSFVAAQTATNFMNGTAAGSATNILSGWWCRARTNNMSAQFDTSVFRSGGASMKGSTLNATGTFQISNFNPSSPTLAQIKQNAYPVLPNTSYEVSLWVKTNNVAADAVFASLTTYKADGTGGSLSSSATDKLTGTNDWTHLTKTIVTGANDVWLQLNLNNTVAGNVSDAWFDDVEIRATLL